MLGLAQTETLTPASHHSSLATHHRLNQSLVFVVFFAIPTAKVATPDRCRQPSRRALAGKF
jgi:hypothetical protein